MTWKVMISCLLYSLFFWNFHMRSAWRCPTKRWALFYSPPFNLTTLAATCDLGQDRTRPDAKTGLQSMSPSFRLVTAWPDTLSVSLSLSPSPSLTTRLRLVRLVSVFALTDNSRFAIESMAGFKISRTRITLSCQICQAGKRGCLS